MRADDLLIVPDMSKAPRYSNLPAVTKPPHARFYCAMPLINRDGFALGTICVWDPELKELSDEQTMAMRRLARLALDKLELRRDLLELQRAQEEAAQNAQRSRDAMARAEEVAHKLVPPAVAVRLLARAELELRHYANTSFVSVGFADFAALTADLGAEPLVNTLKCFLQVIEKSARNHELETVGAAGGAWLGAAGIQRETDDHALRACRAALEIGAEIDRINQRRSADGQAAWPVRIGVHSGTAVAGLLGEERLTYSIWGAAPRIATSVWDTAAGGRVCITDPTLFLVGAHLRAEPGGGIEDSVEGVIATFTLLGPA